MKRVDPGTLRRIYRLLFSEFGPQRWWPGETPFEVAVGAILTQNTSWTNASLAVEALKRAGLLDPVRLDALPRRRLARIIRSSGYFNQKAQRIKVFVRYLLARYGGRMERMAEASTPRLRRELLSLWGIGPETADSILLYGLGKPLFVVDAYTRRFLERHGLIPRRASYAQIQELFGPLRIRGSSRRSFFNEYHALIVQLGKSLCKTKNPKCSNCPVRPVGTLKLDS